MIVWCEQCKTEPLEVEDLSLVRFCPGCLYVDFPQRIIIGIPKNEAEWAAAKEIQRQRDRFWASGMSLALP